MKNLIISLIILIGATAQAQYYNSRNIDYGALYEAYELVYGRSNCNKIDPGLSVGERLALADKGAQRSIKVLQAFANSYETRTYHGWIQEGVLENMATCQGMKSALLNQIRRRF